MLYGFGGFGLSEAPQFRPEVIAFLERGGVYATANIRGGGEYGHTWREAGMLREAERVRRFHRSGGVSRTGEIRVASDAGHHGRIERGLLVGAVMEQRAPDLFAVALAGAAVLDMLRFHRFTGGARRMRQAGAHSNRDAGIARLSADR